MRLIASIVIAWLGGFLLLPAPPTPPAPGQDILRLNYADSGPFGHYFTFCFDSLERDPASQRAVQLWEQGKFQPMRRADAVLLGGHRQQRLWLRATVCNTLAQRTHFVWSLYEYADQATLFIQPNGLGAARREIGASSKVVAGRRPFPARALCLPFWLGSQQQAVLYLRVENHSGVWCLPTDISTTEGFLRYETNYLVYTHWVWLLGIYLGSALFNIILFGLLRDPIHLWYGAYVLFSTWFLMMEDSIDALLLPQWLYGLGWQLSEFGVLLLALACGLRIMSLFVRLRLGWPRLYRLSWVLSVLAAGFALSFPLLTVLSQSFGRAALAALAEVQAALLWLLLLTGLLVVGIVSWRGRRVQRRLARYYSFTYAFFLVGASELVLAYAAVTYSTLVEPNILAWGLALELLSLSVLLTGRFQYALRQNQAQRLRHLQERARAGQQLIQAQDEEREALARELHDALAPGLTALHLAWQGRQVRQALRESPAVLTHTHEHTEALLRQLRHDVRNLSQALLPNPPGEQPPLPEAIALLVETLSLDDGGPRITGHCDPAAAALPVPVQLAAYRIVAELLHNALRHAQARLVQVEVRGLLASLRITVEDDGRGFDPQAAPPRRGGLGLRGVQARAGYLRGQVLVSSQPGQGTVITVELPVR